MFAVKELFFKFCKSVEGHSCLYFHLEAAFWYACLVQLEFCFRLQMSRCQTGSKVDFRLVICSLVVVS